MTDRDGSSVDTPRDWFVLSDDETVSALPHVVCHECQEQMDGIFNKDRVKVAECRECGKRARVVPTIEWVEEGD